MEQPNSLPGHAHGVEVTTAKPSNPLRSSGAGLDSGAYQMYASSGGRTTLPNPDHRHISRPRGRHKKPDKRSRLYAQKRLSTSILSDSGSAVITPVVSSPPPSFPAKKEKTDPSLSVGKEQSLSPLSLPTTPSSTRSLSPNSFSLSDHSPSDSSANVHNRRSREYSRPGGIKDQRKDQKRRREDLKGTRGLKNAQAIAQSVFRDRAHQAGKRDAAKESREEMEPQEQFLTNIQQLQYAYVREFAFVLGTYFWNASLMTYSPAVLALLAKLRSSGYIYTLDATTPSLVIGMPQNENFDTYLRDKTEYLLSSSWEVEQVPFFDQVHSYEAYMALINSGVHLRHFDANFALFSSVGRFACDSLPRFSSVQVSPTWVSKFFPNLRNLHDQFFQDSMVRGLVRSNRVFSEVAITVAMQNLLTVDERPHYALFLPGFLNESVLCCYHANNALYEQRACFGNRRHVFDEKTLDAVSGFTIGSRGFSADLARSVFEQDIKPYIINLKDRILTTVEQFFEEWEGPDSDDPPPRPPSSGFQERSSSDDDVSDDSEMLIIEEEEPSKNGIVPDPSSVVSRSSSSFPSFSDSGFRVNLIFQPLIEGVCLITYEFIPRCIGYDKVVLYDFVQRVARNSQLALLLSTYTSQGIPQYRKFFSTSNLWNLRGVTLQLELYQPQPSHAVFESSPMQVTWQETVDVNTGSFLGEAALHESYDTDRISIQNEQIFSDTSFSEVYYYVFFHKARCFGQSYLLSAVKKRLGRPNQPYNKQLAVRFANFVGKLVFPTIVYENVTPVIERSIYLTFLAKMPALSRAKHLHYFDQLSDPSYILDIPATDGGFVKFDEVLLDPKGRMIINPPPALFYHMVAHLTEAKSALKREMFHNVGSNLFFTYGADLDARGKSEWFSSVMARLGSSNSWSFYVLVGGDDNLILYGKGQTIHALESDVTACDQSHNEGLISAMISALEFMGSDCLFLELLRKSYYRPLRLRKETQVYFHQPQLHTGSPQTSLANTLVIGLISLYCCSIARDEQICDPSRFGECVEELSRGLGMIWKVENSYNALHATFHKGFWVPCDCEFYTHQWLPLPSCIWKMAKIRTDSHIGHTELLTRLAFSCYQRLLQPNLSVVRLFAEKMFHQILRTLDQKEDQLIAYFDSPRFAYYRERALLNHAGEIEPWDISCSPKWTDDDVNDFIQHRYHIDLAPFETWVEQWDGSIGIYYGEQINTLIFRDYGGLSDFESRCAAEIGLVEGETVSL